MLPDDSSGLFPGPRAAAYARAPRIVEESKPILQRPARFVAAGVSAASCFVLFDLLRRGVSSVSIARHLVGATLLYSVVGTLSGLVAWAVWCVQNPLTAAMSRRWPRAGAATVMVLCAALAALASWNTAFWAFTGHRARAASYAGYGPYLVVAAAALAAAALAWVVRWALCRVRRRARLGALLSMSVVAAIACAASWMDLHLLVGLYGRLHVALEVAAGVLLIAAAYVVLAMSEGRVAALVMRVIAGVLFFWTLVFLTAHRARAWVGAELGHVWQKPVYVGRMLYRVELAEVLLAHPRDWRDASMRRLDMLHQRYGGSTALDPTWKRPLAEPARFREEIHRLRGDRHDYNVLVYYVDTLRYDAASDPAIMPHVVGFSRQALDFRKTYSSGSDTLRALPSLTSGSYERSGRHPDDLLQVARRTGHTRVIAIPKSAHEFLGKLDPRFRFDQTLVVRDYAKGRSVWGYGADRSTAKGLVDQTLSWLGSHQGEPFFMWVFNFDQHEWTELDKDYVDGVARRYHVPDHAPLNWRYRVVATGIDAQFGRLLKGLDRLGLADSTIVVFVADHGEGLGREGFWVHGVFLWQCLLRVPLMIRIPGMSPRAIDARVSLVDVAPTLARYLDKDPDTSGYQGEDLVGYLVPERPPRRLPLLMTAASSETPVRIGIVEPAGRWKLVLPLGTAAPQLYDLHAADPDAANVAAEHPHETLHLLGRLVRSPIFQRPAHRATRILAGAR